MKIDLDRGVMCAKCPQGNFYVYMYLDEPGTYYNEHATRVPEKLAKLAGFETARFKMERERRDRQREAMALIDREIESINEAAIKTEPLIEGQGFRVMDLGLGRANLLDPEGLPINSAPLTHEQAISLFKHFVEIEEEEVEEEVDIKPKRVQVKPLSDLKPKE